jgi:hypothetical protein
MRVLHDNNNMLLLFLRDRVQRRVEASCRSNSALVALRDVNVRTSMLGWADTAAVVYGLFQLGAAM